jgi:hypothetical protein
MEEIEKFKNWDEEFKKLKSFSKIDDLDVYKNFELDDLNSIRYLYTQKKNELDFVINEMQDTLNNERERFNLIRNELVLIDIKIKVFKK